MMRARRHHDASGYGRRDAALTARLVELFYVEALLLLDEAQAYCDHPDLETDGFPPEAKAAIGAAFECLFARLEAVLAWLRARRGALAERPELPGLVHLGEEEVPCLTHLPDPARALVGAGLDLYARIQRLEAGGVAQPTPAGPARALQGRLRSSF